jgi:hypothetical protein
LVFTEGDYSNPGTKTDLMQSEGHHRVAAAAAIERETGKPIYLPTNYKDATSAARKRVREGRPAVSMKQPNEY